MAKRRLTQRMREMLISHIQGVVSPKKELASLEAAYAKAAPLVMADVHKKYPPNDMKICRKYDATFVDDCIKLSFPDTSVHMFNFAEDTGPLVTKRTYNNQIYLASDRTAKAVEVWISAKECFDKAQKDRVAAYKALVHGAGYLDDVVEVWPEARTIIPLNALPIALGPEQIAIVKADLKERKVA